MAEKDSKVADERKLPCVFIYICEKGRELYERKKRKYILKKKDGKTIY